MPTPPTPPRTLLEIIIYAGCQYFNCTEEQLKSREMVEERKIMYYIIRTETMIGYLKIAKRFGYKHHSFTADSVAEIESTKDIYPQISRNIKKIMEIVTTLL